MDDHLDIKKYINSKTEDFYEYLRVIVLDDDSFEVLKSISKDSEVFIFCGIIRDYFLKRFGHIRDFDFVFKNRIKLNNSQREYVKEKSVGIKKNSFKGFKLHSQNGFDVDFWQLNHTWGIIHKGIEFPTPNSLIDCVFFNFSAIAFDFNKHKFIYNEHFVNFLHSRTIDIVYEENSNIPLCLFNLFYYPKLLRLKISTKARQWIKRHLNENVDFEKVQQKHLGRISYSQQEVIDYLKSEFDTIGAYGIDWDKYLSTDRVKKSTKEYRKEGMIDQRSEFESDFGRVVFSSAMRRMHDKTQVIPLTSGDKIHTRLTHSIEVMNTAQSLAINLCRDRDFIEEYGQETAFKLEQRISAILKTAAFVHDIGNPPFGHFGETIIKNYFRKYLDGHILCDKFKIDYEEFDGNAQGFRILTHLSYIGYLSGLNLTYSTLAAYLKYPNSGKVDKSYIGTKKHGIYITEKKVFNKIVEACNLRCSDGHIKRHHLSFLVEAADSICYNVMDIEDGYLLHWYDKDTILEFLDRDITKLINGAIEEQKKRSKQDGENAVNFYRPYLHEESQIYSFMKIVCKDPKFKLDNDKNRVHWIMDFRVKVIQYLVELASKNFKTHIHEIDEGAYSRELIEDDNFYVTKTLQNFTKRHIFPQPTIQRAELTGHSVINGLLDILIKYISSNDIEFRKRLKNIISKSGIRVSYHEELMADKDYSILTEDEYYELDLAKLSDNAKLRLVVDFVSGMTDKYAVSLYQQLTGNRI